jgi:tRNA(fMet)-specific endonuclease VapC
VIFLLDTDICIFMIRKRPESVFDRLRKQSVGQVSISSITHSELYHGALKSEHPKKNLAALDEFVTPLKILPYDSGVSLFYAKVRHALEKKGQPIGPLDTLIAAHALSLNLILVTNNTREFKRVSGLQVQNWL